MPTALLQYYMVGRSRSVNPKAQTLNLQGIREGVRVSRTKPLFPAVVGVQTDP